MKLKIYRQGDVLIEQISKLPKGLKRQKPNGPRIILALGEATGHHHSIDTDSADWWKGEGDDQFVTVADTAALEHQEHSTIQLPPGNYHVRRQREYSPEAIRNVQD